MHSDQTCFTHVLHEDDPVVQRVDRAEVLHLPSQPVHRDGRSKASAQRRIRRFQTIRHPAMRLINPDTLDSGTERSRRRATQRHDPRRRVARILRDGRSTALAGCETKVADVARRRATRNARSNLAQASERRQCVPASTRSPPDCTMCAGSPLPGRERSRQRRLADRRDRRGMSMHARSTPKALRARAMGRVRVHVRREGTEGRAVVRRSAAAPSSTKVLHGRRVAVHLLVVDMGLGLVLWRQSIWPDLERPCLPCEAIEAICVVSEKERTEKITTDC